MSVPNLPFRVWARAESSTDPSWWIRMPDGNYEEWPATQKRMNIEPRRLQPAKLRLVAHGHNDISAARELQAAAASLAGS